VNEQKVQSSPSCTPPIFFINNNDINCQLVKGNLEAESATKRPSEIADTDITLPLPLCVIEEPCADGKSDNEIALEKQSKTSKELVMPFF
jgi:hypothetical protein